MTLLALLALLLAGVAVASIVWALVLPRARADARLHEIDLYGYAAESAAAPSAGRAGPGARALAQRLGDVLGQRFGTDQDSKIRKEILAAGLYSLTPRALVGYQVLGAAVGIGLGLTFDVIPNFESLFVDTVLLAGVGWIVPITYVRRTGRLRLLTIDRAVPDVIDLIVVAVEAGAGFTAAVTVAAERTHGPLGNELRLTLQEQRFGLPMDRALENFNQRADTPNVRTFVRGIVQGERLGVSIGQIMRNIAVEMRVRRRQNAEERAQKTTVKILIPLVFLILPPLVIVLLTPAILSLSDFVGS